MAVFAEFSRVTKIIYNKYDMYGNFIAERVYMPTDREDYKRVMEIIERNPDEYEIVNCEYEFEYRKV